MLLKNTKSVCPKCLKQIPARQVKRGEDIYLEKSCPEHGDFSAVVWRGSPEILDWSLGRKDAEGEGNPDCPHACGLCGHHDQNTCCMLLEITERCNLTCPVCFAESGEKKDGEVPKDPTLEEIKGWLADIARLGGGLVQLSGGEPTVRDDLSLIVKAAKDAGIEYVQLNSNGVRLAHDLDFVKELADAGLSFVFMQFDGTDDKIYRKLRGKDLFDIKKQAIINCGRANLGVTLVPTLVPGVNVDNLGKMIEFGTSMSPYVRGIHIQPISYFGRYEEIPDDSLRVTLPEVVREIERQSNGRIQCNNLAPGKCDHPMCGFHGSFIVWPDSLEALTHRDMIVEAKMSRTEEEEAGDCCCGASDPAVQNRNYIAKRWLREEGCCGGETVNEAVAAGINEADCCGEDGCCDGGQAADTEGCCCGDQAEDFMMPEEGPVERTMDSFLARAKSHSFTITAMAFQDGFTLDLARIRKCSLHVYNSGKVVPFCANYLTSS